ncbi:hypothetical protein RUND412_001761 [Rhizina undulata]
MESLPAEILQEIVGHLSGDDLDSVRLVSRELSGVAAVSKFRTLRVPVNRKGLKHLLFVSQQPALADCVREIIYPSGYLPPVAAFKSSSLFFTKYGSSLDVAEVIQVARIFVEWYKKKDVEQAKEARRFWGLDNVRDAFDKWRGTQNGIRRRAVIDMHAIDMEWDIVWVHSLCTDQTKDSEARGEKQILDLIDVSNRVGLKPQSLTIGSRVLRNCAPLFENLTSLSLYNDVPYQSNYYTPVQVLENTIKWRRLHKFLSSAKNLRFLSPRTLDTLSLHVYSLPRGACKDHCAPFIENLTSLSLYLDGPYKSNPYTPVEDLEKAIKGGRVHTFLSSAPNLRFLSLTVNYCDIFITDEHRPLPLLDIFGNTCVWKYLHTLHFGTSTTIIDVEDLTDVLRRHSGTLDSLSLDVK